MTARPSKPKGFAVPEITDGYVEHAERAAMHRYADRTPIGELVPAETLERMRTLAEETQREGGAR